VSELLRKSAAESSTKGVVGSPGRIIPIPPRRREHKARVISSNLIKIGLPASNLFKII